MKLFGKNNKQVNTIRYEKRCECCGRRFSATYPSDNYYLYQSAKDIVNSHYNSHKLFCSNVNEEYVLSYSA